MSQAVPLPPPHLLGWQVPDASHPPAAAGMVRTRVNALLDTLLAPGAERRVGLVVAPAGSGKTTAVAHWAAEREGATAWLRVPGGARPGQLSRQAREAVAGTAATRPSSPVVLVLDDLQHLGGPQAPSELEELVLTSPADVVLLLLSRAPLPCDFARAELPQPLRLGREDLRLLPHELQAALEQHGAGRLPATTTTALAAATDGWPAAVPLLVEAGRSGLSAQADRVVADGAPWAAEYLERQVLAGLSPALRALLVDCSPLLVLDGPRCDARTGRTDGAAALRELARAGVLEPVPGALAAYRCHPVLRAHLRGELGAGAAPPLSLRAAAPRVERDDLLDLLLHGDRRGAAALAGRLPGSACLVGRLAWHALRGLLDDAPDATAELVALQRALGVGTGATLLAGVAALLDGVPGFAGELADELDRQSEPVVALALRGAVALAGCRAGEPDLALLDRLVADGARLGTQPALLAWARGLHALAAARAQLPEAERAAAAAQVAARDAGVPAAGALADAALALCRPEQAPALLRRAEDAADAAGLLCRPWEWGARSGPALRVAPAGRAPQVRVTCFGGFELHVDGAAPDLSALRPRARTLLRLLALHGGAPVHREQLVDALWGDLPAAAGLHNLQVAVSSLRQALEPGRPPRASVLLRRQGEAYVLELGPGGGVDLQEFDAALTAAEQTDGDPAQALLQTALALYRGDLLPEDGPADWVVEVRERYRLRAAEAAGRLAALRLAAGDSRGAVTAALRSVELDRYRDASWHLLVQACHEAGDVAQAARAHQAYLALLDELGLPADVVAAPAPLQRRPAPSTRRAAGQPQPL